MPSPKKKEGNTSSGLDKQIAQAEKEVARGEYAEVARAVEKNAVASPKPRFTDRVKATAKNIGNIGRNMFDNTVGLPIAIYQNYQTARYFKKNPQSDAQIAYLGSGWQQNRGAQWRLARELRKDGYHPYHVKAHASEAKTTAVQKVFDEIKEFHRKTGLRGAQRHDIYSGHSSGADIGIHMATNPKVHQYGIGTVQARAPAPYGIYKPKTIAQRVFSYFSNPDNIAKNPEAQRAAMHAYRKKPLVPVHVVSGDHDALVTHTDAQYRHAASHEYLHGPYATHAGTSGSNQYANKELVRHIRRTGESHGHESSKVKRAA